MFVSISFLVALLFLETSSLLSYSVCGILNTRRNNHIYVASKHFLICKKNSSVFIAIWEIRYYISARLPFSLFLMYNSISLYLLIFWKASFAVPMRLSIAFSYDPSSLTTLFRYTNFYTSQLPWVVLC